MRYTEILEACWKGYRQAGMKKKGDRMVPNCVPVSEQEMEEDLKKWFKEKWVRFGPDGKIRGDCARGSSKEGKPKCLPQAKAHALGKKGRASAAAKKRREDPNPERRGPAKNVATKVKEVKDINAVRDLIKQSGASNAFQQADNKEQQAMSLLNQLKDLNAKNDPLSGYDQKYTKEVKRIVNAILDLGYEVEGPTNGQYTLRTKTWEDNTTVAEGFEYGSRVQHPKYGAGQVIRVYSNGTITVNFPNYPDPIDKKPGVQSNFGPGDKDYQSLKPMVSEKQDACYRKVKSRYKVWPSAYASGALVQCRKKGAANWGNKGKK